MASKNTPSVAYFFTQEMHACTLKNYGSTAKLTEFFRKAHPTVLQQRYDEAQGLRENPLSNGPS